MDRRIPVEAVGRLAGPRQRLDGLLLARREPPARDLAALVLGVDQVGVLGIDEGVKAVAGADVDPIAVLDAADRRRRSGPGAVVLQAAVDAVRPPHVVADVVELRHRQGPEEAPLPAFAVRHVDAAVGAEQHLVRVLRVDPERVMVAVRTAEGRTARGVEGLAAVRAHRQRIARFIDGLVVRGIDDEMGEVERPHLDVERRVDLPPALADVVRTVEGRLLRLDQGIDDARPRRRHGHRDPPLVAGRQAFLERPPGLAAVGRLVEAAPLAAGAERPGGAPELPHARVEDRRILRIDGEIGAAGVGVDVEHPFPGLAAVGRLVDAALLVAVPQVAGGANPDRIAVRRVHLDAGDALRASPDPPAARSPRRRSTCRGRRRSSCCCGCTTRRSPPTRSWDSRDRWRWRRSTARARRRPASRPPRRRLDLQTPPLAAPT